MEKRLELLPTLDSEAGSKAANLQQVESCMSPDDARPVAQETQSWDENSPECPSARAHVLPSGIDSRFVIRREISSGGMGSVYEAYDTKLDRRLAIKRQHPSNATHTARRKAFVEEARISSRLDHPNIAPVHDLHADDLETAAYFVMKLVEGESLSTTIHSRECTPANAESIRRFLDLFEKICDGVAFAHSRNVLHLDLKPENIMFGAHGEVYVMDWGIAVECERSANGWLVAPPHANSRGTPAYMAPEQVEGAVDRIDQRTDIHGLGAIFYDFLCAKPPYPVSGGHSAFERRRKSSDLRPTDLRTISSIPPQLAELVMRCLDPNPQLRPSSVEEVQREIKAIKRTGGWSSVIHFAPGQIIIEEDTPGDAAYFIQSGTCEAIKFDGSNEIHLRTMGPGEVFGEMALLTANVRSATVRALDHVELVVMTRHYLDQSLDSQGWLGTLIRTLANRFRDVDQERLHLRKLLLTDRPDEG
jgi:serine/threonine-protein kinase